MKTKAFATALLFCSAFSLPVMAQATTPAITSDNVVTFTGNASMPSYRDPALKDTFTVNLVDKQIVTNYTVRCQNAIGGLFGKKQDQQCSVTGAGSIVHPQNGKKIPRVQYAGGYTVGSDGFTDGGNITVNYMAVGKVGASSSNFKGSLMLKPEKASTGASLMSELILAKVQAKAGDQLIDKRIDTVQFSNFSVPSAGLPSDQGCTWNGNLVFTYQTSSWFMDVNAKCGNKDYHLKGNMPWTESPGGADQTQYDINLVLPENESNSNDDLFVDATQGGGDIFAAADGISGQIIMKESGYTNVVLEGTDTKQSTLTDISGNFTGHNLPIETVRSFAQLVVFLSKTFYGV